MGWISGPRRSARDGAAIWLVIFGLYLLFSGSAGAGEVGVGALCASLATLWWWGVGRRGGVRFRFGHGALRPVPSALAGLSKRTLVVGLRLARRVFGGAWNGSVVERPASDFGWAAPGDGEAAPAARAVGILSASLAPDGYVMRLDRAHGTVSLHDIGASQGSDGGRS